eukprot:967374-Rhodomonas_salina.1
MLLSLLLCPRRAEQVCARVLRCRRSKRWRGVRGSAGRSAAASSESQGAQAERCTSVWMRVQRRAAARVSAASEAEQVQVSGSGRRSDGSNRRGGRGLHGVARDQHVTGLVQQRGRRRA